MGVIEPEERGLSIRDLLLEVRKDIRVIDAKLEGKADRARVHEILSDIAEIRLDRVRTAAVQAEDISFIRSRIETLPDHEIRLRTLERFRYAVPSVAALGLLMAAVSAVVTLIH